MIEFLKRFFGTPPSSSNTAKDRLRLVLMTDHLALAPEMVEQLKRDLVDVISRYVEVDRERIEVNFEEHDRALAMLANIPILSVNRPDAPAPPATTTSTPPVAEQPTGASASVASDGGAIPTRKRRRRRKAQLGVSSPNPAVAQ